MALQQFSLISKDDDSSGFWISSDENSSGVSIGTVGISMRNTRQMHKNQVKLLKNEFGFVLLVNILKKFNLQQK